MRRIDYQSAVCGPERIHLAAAVANKVHNQGGPAALAVRFRDPDGTLRSSSPALDAK